MARDIVLAHMIDNRDYLGEVPNLGDLEGILKLMPTDCSPGSDGITLEVLRACSYFIGKDILEMVIQKSFWEIGTVAYKISEGIIKLIPKTINKQAITD